MNITTPHIKEQDANPYKREQIKIDPAGHQAIKDRVARIIAATCGGAPNVTGNWWHGKLFVCNKFYVCEADVGWYRWQLPSSDGIVRARDDDAPRIHLSPSGAVFWLQKRSHLPKRVTIEQLLDRCQKWAAEVAV